MGGSYKNLRVARTVGALDIRRRRIGGDAERAVMSAVVERDWRSGCGRHCTSHDSTR